MFISKKIILGLLFSILVFVSSEAKAWNFVVTNVNDSGPGSLRDAIEKSNNYNTPVPGQIIFLENRITFHIPGNGPHTIQLNSPLPVIFNPGGPDPDKSLLIDGFSQPGASLNNIKIYIKGVGDVFHISGPFVSYDRITIQGLAIGELSSGSAIYSDYEYPLYLDINNNYIGTDVSGLQERTIQDTGIIIKKNGAGISNNVISGCQQEGIHVDSEGSQVVSIKDNIIGLDVAKNNAIPNGYGIRFGNLIDDGQNKRFFIENNTIAKNKKSGVDIFAPKYVTITANSIFDNKGLGIDLASDGPTANDFGDSDDGANYLVNFPVLTSAKLLGQALEVKFDLDVDATRTTSFRVEFFANDGGPISLSPDEGKYYLGFINVTTDNAAGSTQHTANIPLPLGVSQDMVQKITATATENLSGQSGSTSEFSRKLKVQSGYDYGDAPDPSMGTGTGNYQTQATDFGPSHFIGGVYLGSGVDGDNGTLHNVSATADDADAGAFCWGTCAAGDDEDGVIWPNLSPFQITNVTVKSSGSGFVSAWVDFNQDGIFSNFQERVINNQHVNAGDNVFGVAVFGNLPYGEQTYARVRISTQGGLDSIGPANDGEVEDYRVTVIGDKPTPLGGGSQPEKWTPIEGRK